MSAIEVASDIATSTMKKLNEGSAPVVGFKAVWQRTAADTEVAGFFESSPPSLAPLLLRC
jgi:hypothetical protein